MVNIAGEISRIRAQYSDLLVEFEQQRQNMRRLWNIDQETAEFLFGEIILRGANSILEIGTSNGFSTFWLIQAAELTSGSVITIESDRKRYQLACRNLNEFTNARLISTLAEDFIPTLQQKFDFIFIDAGKINYLDYLRLLMENLADNTLIIADNVISHRSTVNEYLDFVRNNRNFESRTLAIGSGLEYSLYKSEIKER